MKKFYVAPEIEELETELEMVLAASTESEDITDGPTPIDDNPGDDDLEW